ncbi:unnamed protein product [Leptosia nina]|uniref:Secreted protein n=1 Tax=Leptosia nina TaxID=320188 RepID=A0AAV1JTL4_9NEOP
MVKLDLAMVMGVAPALVSWWRGHGPWLQPLVTTSPCLEKPPKSWPTRRSPSLSDCLASSDEDSPRSIVCLVRPKAGTTSAHMTTEYAAGSAQVMFVIVTY